MKVYVQSNYSYDRYEFWLDPGYTGRQPLAMKHVEFETHDIEEGVMVEPTFVIDQDTAQNLMQAMWNAGIRPQGLEPPTDMTIESLRNHIKFAESVLDRLLGD